MEDAGVTVAIVACLALAWIVMPAFHVSAQWRGGIRFTLLGVALVENVWRTAGRRMRP